MNDLTKDEIARAVKNVAEHYRATFKQAEELEKRVSEICIEMFGDDDEEEA